MSARGRHYTTAHSVMLALLSAAANAETLTLMVAHDCPGAQVVRKGDRIIVRCGGTEWLSVDQRACPNVRLTKDAQGNYTLRCG